jgi:excisionase family DNA binding protein
MGDEERSTRSAKPKRRVDERGEDTLLTDEEVADILAITARRVRQFFYDGELPGVYVGNQLRFERAAVDALIERNRVSGPRPTAARPPTLRKRPVRRS